MLVDGQKQRRGPRDNPEADSTGAYADAGMVMSDNAKQLFQHVEDRVLDKVHKRFSILFRGEALGVKLLLRAAAQSLRELCNHALMRHDDYEKVIGENRILGSLSHCLRWIREHSHHEVPYADFERLAQEARDLLRWGSQYDTLWNEHSAYRGSFSRFEVDESTKTIAFAPTYDPDPRFFCSQCEAKRRNDERMASTRPETQLLELSRDWFDSGPMFSADSDFDDTAIARSGAIDVAQEWLDTICVPELDGTATLPTGTVADLRRVLAAIYVYSLFRTALEVKADNTPSINVPVESAVESRTREAMINWLAGLSDVSYPTVEAIASTLTFDPAHPGATVANQPLIHTREGEMHFVPRMILSLDFQHLGVRVLKAMKEPREKRRGAVVCVEKSSVYDRLGGAIEDNGVSAICDRLRHALSPQVQVLRKPKLRLPTKSKVTPDIVIVSNDREVLVVDVKYAMSPLGPLDIRRDISEVRKWKGQMDKYIDAFTRYPDLLLPRAGVMTERTKVWALILLRWPFPVPVDFEPPLYAVDWPSLEAHVRTQSVVSLRRLLDWVRDRPDLPMPEKLQWKEKELRVVDWTYRYSVLVNSVPAR